MYKFKIIYQEGGNIQDSKTLFDKIKTDLAKLKQFGNKEFSETKQKKKN
jgi:hypothetical protein